MVEAGRPAHAWGGHGRSILAVAAMLAGVIALYCPASLLSGDSMLYGMDFWSLHLRRLAFAREHLTLPWFALPGWYPRELMGTPFWSNLQNFPWIPTRLALLAVDPPVAYAIGVNLAAALAALFTYLYARSIGWGHAAAALAGWTFACGGFFAARVMAGHLSTLEAYPALPLLLWLVERALRGQAGSRSLAALSAATACVVVAGHPQLPAYAVAAALVYLFWIGRGRRAWEGAAAIALGAASTLAVWWPMLGLVGRSTRILALETAHNDLTLPYSRLGAFFLPWKDGWPAIVQRTPPESFTGFPSAAWFWDTVVYVGVVPWVAVLGLLVAVAWRRQRPGRRAAFFTALGVGSLLLALPFVRDLTSQIPGTYLRSPSRLVYLTTFALSLGAGAGLDLWLRSQRPRGTRLRALLAGIVVALHVADLAGHDRPFIRVRPPLFPLPGAESLIAEQIGSGRVAIDYNLSLTFNRRFDDVGVFDSLLLARPYRALIALAGWRADTNVQSLAASALPARALQDLGVRFVVTRRELRDLELILQERYSLYRVPDPSPRAAFFPTDRVEFLGEDEMLTRFRQGAFSLGSASMLPPAAREALPDPGPLPSTRGETEVEVEYERASPDRIALRLHAPGAGFVRVLESWDPGWRATLDGEAVPALRADTFAMAVAVGPGEHHLELRYETPGSGAGAVGSLLSLLPLAWLLWTRRRVS
jgi:hypothetical protein